jgi:aryl-alcohol dehydrogenase-like predicted oxidoreductase
MGLGLAALGRPGYITLGHEEDVGADISVAAMERGAHEVLDSAYTAGIRYFDAARSYGRAEAFLASWLDTRRLEPGAVTVASKWGYTYTAGWTPEAEQHEVKDLSAATLRRQLGESRSLLDGHLSLYQIHSATLESGVLDDSEVLAELAELRGDGVEIGLSVTGPRQRETIERALELGAFDAVQATWNLLERSATEALAAANDAGLRLVVNEALANGRLTRRGDAHLLEEAALERMTTADALALAAALAEPWAHVVLSGAATVEMLRSNLAALDVDVDEDLRAQLADLAEPAEAYWSRRASLRWS